MSGGRCMSLAVAAVAVAATFPAASGAAGGPAITAVQAPATALVGGPFDLGVDVTAPAAIEVTRADSGAVVASAPAGALHVVLSLTLSTPGTVRLHVAAGASTSDASVEVAEFGVDAASILVPAMAGFGAQFNHSLFYPPLNPLVPPDGASLAEKMMTLEPRLVRVFFPAQALTDWQRLSSFQKVVELAQRSGATIEVTWSGGYGNVDSNMWRFGHAIADLVKNHGVTNLQWVSLLNEPNGNWDPPVDKDTYARMYDAVDQSLRAEGVRHQVKLMGGELVQNGQRAWLDYMVDHMRGVLDAYSIHVYWDYTDTAKLESRLNEVRSIDLRTGPRPLYVTEFGVRGVRDWFGNTVPQPGLWRDPANSMAEIPMIRTNVTAFQLAWFNVLASRLGYTGTITWDAFNAKYDSGTQDYSCVGPAPDFDLRPCYFLLRLFTATTEPGWRVVGVDGYSGGKLLTAYTGDGMETVVGLDRGGGQLNVGSGPAVPYSVTGLPPATPFRLVTWNRDGSGGLSEDGVVTTDALGVATLTVPQHAVFALTTHP